MMYLLERLHNFSNSLSLVTDSTKVTGGWSEQS